MHELRVWGAICYAKNGEFEEYDTSDVQRVKETSKAFLWLCIHQEQEEGNFKVF